MEAVKIQNNSVYTDIFWLRAVQEQDTRVEVVELIHVELIKFQAL